MKKLDEARYTTILHGPRIRAGLTCNEYVVADSVYKLSSNPRFPVCTAGQEYLAKFMGITRKGMNQIMGRLQKMGYILKVMDEKTFVGWTHTEKWYSDFVAKEKEEGGSNQRLQGGSNPVTGGVTSGDKGSNQSSHNKNSNIDSNNNIIKRIQEDFYMKTGRLPNKIEIQRKLNRMTGSSEGEE